MQNERFYWKRVIKSVLLNKSHKGVRKKNSKGQIEQRQFEKIHFQKTFSSFLGE